MLGLPWPRLKPLIPISIMWNCTTGICPAHVACCYTGTLGLNPDTPVRFGLLRSSINIWADSPSVPEILKLSDQARDQIWFKDRTISEASCN